MPVDKAEVLRQLHDQHAAAVWRYAARLTGNSTQADDVVQETLLRAWRTPHIMEQDPGSTRAWLMTVARNLVIDEARSAKSRHERASDSLPERSQGDATNALFDALLVAEALASLSEDHRAVIIRAYYKGCTCADVAAELGIATGTVKSRLHYGLRALRLALQEKGVTR